MDDDDAGPTSRRAVSYGRHSLIWPQKQPVSFFGQIYYYYAITTTQDYAAFQLVCCFDIFPLLWPG